MTFFILISEFTYKFFAENWRLIIGGILAVFSGLFIYCLLKVQEKFDR